MTIGHVLRKSFSSTLRRSRWIKNHCYSSSAAEPKLDYKVDSTIMGYSIKEVEKIEELNLTAVLLKHRSTGAEHLHLSCADTNNVFAVGFRTPPPDSSGVPHILEHLSLCGSRNFPCRDPFFNMLNRSLSTFMNAFTGSDTTIYAFSSQNPKDFQNLLSVYLDATFYPLLLEKDFRQEGWRLEHEDINDKNSPIVLKGVVYNEMKGVFSDPGQYYARHLQNYLFPSNAYSHESGGDPLAIPQLTWEGLKNFHSTLYHPSNSRFFTYGNMPLEVHLEKIDNHVLQNFKKISIENEIPDVEIWSKPKEKVIYNRFDPMAANPENQTIISDSFVLNRITDTYENFALSILGTLLVDGPNSPFYQKLLQAGIGPDYSPCTGFDSSIKQSVFSVGLREIAEKDIDHVKELIPSIFKDVIDKGFPKKQVRSVLHKIELATKHRTANFGLNCALGVNSLWNHNGHPVSAFKVNDHVKWFKNQLKDNPHFLQDKIVQYFQDNPHKLTLIMKPDQNFEAQEQAKEKALLDSKVSKLNDTERQQIYQQGLELAEHQKQHNTSCLPTLQINDVKKTIEKTPLTIIPIAQKDVCVLQICEQPTNEVTYFRYLIDASGLSEEDVMLLPLFSNIITQMGAGMLDYKQLDQEIQLKTGRFDVSLHLSEDPSDPRKFKQALLLSSYCLDKNVEDMFNLWMRILNYITLEDSERLTQLIQLSAAEMAQSIAHSGHRYAMQKASSSLSHCSYVREMTSGLSQISFMKKLAEKQSHEELLEKLKSLAQELFDRIPIRCSLNGMPNSLNSSFACLDNFLLGLTKSYIPEFKKVHYEAKSQKSHFVLPFSVNYLGQSILTVPYCNEDFASLKVAAKLMSSKFLHTEIREKGGAYGGGASISKGGHFTFFSYRDPNVEKTLKTFSSGIEWLLKGSYSDQDINEAKLGVFSEVDAPVPPGSKGMGLFLEGITDEMKEQMRHNIFSCTQKNLKFVAEKYLENPKLVGTALVGPENSYTKSEDNWNIETNEL